MSPPRGAEAGSIALVVLGQEHRGDDAAALRALDILRPGLGPEVVVRAGAADPAVLLAAFADVHDRSGRAVVVDVLRDPTCAPGTLVGLAGAELDPSPAQPRFSSHGGALGAALALARALQSLPMDLVVHGVVGRNFALGAPLTPAVAAAVPALAAAVLAELKAARRDGGLRLSRRRPRVSPERHR